MQCRKTGKELFRLDSPENGSIINKHKMIIVRIKFLVLMLLCSKFTFGQLADYYSKYLFQNDEVKYKFVSYKSIPFFSNPDNKWEIDFFKIKKAVKIKIYFKKKNESFLSIIKTDTIYNGIRVIDIYFSLNDYRSLVSSWTNLRKNDIYDKADIFDFFKSSGIVCFNDSKLFVRIIQTNDCVEHPSFVKFKKAFKKSNPFNYIVSAECGVYNLELIKKKP